MLLNFFCFVCIIISVVWDCASGGDKKKKCFISFGGSVERERIECEMGSVGFNVEAESQPSTSNGKKYKLPKTLLDGCGAVNHALVPKKLRSAIKKRVRETVNSSLPIPKKKRHVSNGVETLRKDGAKKSKLHHKKKRHITKDEEEVAETLFALAGMFSDPKKAANQPELDEKSPETKSSAIIEDAGIPSPEEESGNLVDSTTQDVKLQSLSIARQSNENQLVDHMAEKRHQRKRVSTLGMTLNGDMATDLEQATTLGIKHGKKINPMDDKYNGSILSPSFSAAGTLSINGQGSCKRPFINRLPTWFESTNLASQPREIEKCITTNKNIGSKNSWKRCTAHVYICNLIKVLKISEEKKKEGLLQEKPFVGLTNQMTGTNNGLNSFNGFSVKDSAEFQIDRRPFDHHDQQLASETSAKQGYDFLSLGMGFSGLEGGDAPKQYNVSQNCLPVLFSMPQNGYSSSFNGVHNSALAAQQVQIPQHLSSSFTARMGQQLESLHQKWAATQYSNNTNNNNSGGLISPFLPDWKNGYAGRDAPSMVNYAHSLFPHLHAAALGSKYQQFSHHQQLMAINSSSSLSLSNVKKHQHLPFGFERNGAAFYTENVPQLQLPCNQHL